MGLFDAFKGKKEEPETKEDAKEVPSGKYSEECSVCGGPNSDKKWMGQYFHKKCLRKMKKQAKGML